MGYSFNRATLARCLIAKDFYIDDELGNEEYRKDLINRALELAAAAPTFNPAISVNSNSRKPQYTIANLDSKIILRKCSENIKKTANIKLKPRNKIISEIKNYLKDGTSCRIYRLDISSFFEKCDTKNIIDLLSQYGVPTHTINLMSAFLNYFNKNYVEGIPRGIETSPILAELVLKGFDQEISKDNDVFYYSRYVDDIFIVTSARECQSEFFQFIRKSLPKGLSLNYNKTYISTIGNRTIGYDNVSEFEYLGYKISVIDSDLNLLNPTKPSLLKKIEYRDVLVDLSEKKKKRIMEKISKSLYSYHKNKDYRLLLDRIVFLSTNRDLVEKNKKRKIPTGVYYSYSEIDYPSKSLQSIDVYLRNTLLGSGSRISKIIKGDLTKAEIKHLLKNNFCNGYKNRVFKRFCPNRLKQIARIW